MTKPQYLGKAVACISVFLVAGFYTMTAGSPQAQPVSFDTAKKSAAGLGSLGSARVGDFNRDGNRDLAVTRTPLDDPADRRASVLLGNGDGTFQDAVDLAVGGTPQHLLVVSYFNGDSIEDLAVARTDGKIAVLLGNGDGTFRAPLDSVTGLEGPTFRAGIDYGDFNGDHSQDLMVTNDTTTAILLGNGDGTFRTPLLTSPDNFSGAVAGYFNDDGILDVVTDGIRVHPGKGDGTFGAPITSPGGSASGSIVVGYFNNDAIADLALSFISGTAILLGNGDGTFRTGSFLVSSRNVPVLVDDFDGDTITDLATVNSNEDFVSIALGRGDGTFRTLAVTFPMRGFTLVGEFNGDGITDLASSDGDGMMVVLGYGDGTFRGIRGYELSVGGFKPVEDSTVAPGEFNGDGIQDLAVAILSPETGSKILVLLGNGDGSFQWAFDFPASISFYPSLAVGEFNRDGIQDLVIASSTLSGGTVGVFLGNGNGTFQPVMNFPGVANPSAIAIGYFNPDAFHDLAVVASGGISVLLGNGDGTFQAPLFFDTGVPVIGLTRRSIAVGDFNRDGTEDLVANNAPAPSLAVLLGNGNGTFRAPLIFDAGGDGFSLAIGDFNSDRIQDLATTTSFPYPPGISVLLGNGNGTFRTPSFLSLGPVGEVRSIAVGDFNSDGIHDLAAASSRNVSVPLCNVLILLGNGAGTFQPPVSFLIGGFFSYSIAIGRFNTDYRPDIAVSGSGIRGLFLMQHKISVLINNTP